MINTHAYESTPDSGRPARTFGRAPHKQETDRARDHKRNRTPVEAIVEVLSEIQEVIVENISQRFDHVRKDVRIGRDSILRGAAASLEGMCVERVISTIWSTSKGSTLHIIARSYSASSTCRRAPRSCRIL
ncbi:hypothetical protein C8R47DRAFT_296547 [Mycena vitilis]|nr:hypothetical protein C8R47DRAFT_296547 [Mycena vitilis]